MINPEKLMPTIEEYGSAQFPDRQIQVNLNSVNISHSIITTADIIKLKGHGFRYRDVFKYEKEWKGKFFRPLFEINSKEPCAANNILSIVSDSLFFKIEDRSWALSRLAPVSFDFLKSHGYESMSEITLIEFITKRLIQRENYEKWLSKKFKETTCYNYFWHSYQNGFKQLFNPIN